MNGCVKLVSMCWFLPLAIWFGCDTADNVEDPDLHYFVKYYGGDGNQHAVDMIALQDGSFMLLGNYSLDAFTDIYLVKVDSEGDLLWEKKFGGADGTDILTARDLEQTSDGNFIVLADFQGNIGAQTDIQLFKISPDGTPLDSIAPFGTAANDYARGINLLDDGGFIVSGTTQFTAQWTPSAAGLDPGDTFNYRFDQNLTPLSENDWSPAIHGFGAEEGAQFDVAIQTMQTADAYYVFGYTNSNLNNNNQEGRLGLFYFERQLSGGTIARTYYPGNVVTANDTEVNFVDKVPAEMGGGFLVIGTSKSNINVSDIFMARFRNTLSFAPPLQNDAALYTTIPLQRNIQGVAAASSVFGELGYLVLGNEVRSTGAVNFWLSKVDQSGGVLWSTTFGSEVEDDFGAAVTELPDGKIVILGTMGLADNQSKMALIKMNPRGELLK
jgi:hypothetical protein